MGIGLKNIFARTVRALRDDLKMHVLTVLSIVVGFVCLGAALMILENLSRFAKLGQDQQRLTVYLSEHLLSGAEIERVGHLLETLNGVAHVAYRSPHTRQQTSAYDAAPSDLAAEVLPRAFEVVFDPGISAADRNALMQRIDTLSVVVGMETQEPWLERLSIGVRVVRFAAVLLALLLGICVVIVIGNAARLTLHNRRLEIEVLRLSGATDGFVRTPLMLEGALQGTVAAVAALLLLLIGYHAAYGSVALGVPAAHAMKGTFLHPLTATSLVLFGAIAGATGTALALRRDRPGDS